MATQETNGNDSTSFESNLTQIEEALKLKEEGNQYYFEKKYEEAIEIYSEAIHKLPSTHQTLPILFANRAACYLQKTDFDNCVKDCNQAINLDNNYLKAIQRRASAFEKLNNFEDALKDYKKIIQLDPTNEQARKMIPNLEKIVEVEREKKIQEAIGSFKKFGNSILGNFGISLDNFQCEKDENTGSYNINYKN
eukprot:TRINITY_DN4611_c0_g1_i1.p1 TRINITY_DN4611_c0_g1~~TRINITY_DN4611_c0_g1_i1.p1  ORF type:complete len:194 (+),score=67.38 TRINITY_DN4611_c0_g1_i1:58-639(+)